ncbi:hypothetical protein HLB35_00165 [Halomonas sp. TBZ9]|uniref:G domain-containing protein n=1 Tax=Vreelandella azerica TaxID=2732867 RepID=A0A7Y3TV20_9GAMM|nr:hypothetical protein [Halomonas azerica]NOG30575.1 hypothetical protein [Halomonas azerica]
MKNLNSYLVNAVENFAQSFEKVSAGEEELMNIRDEFARRVMRISPVQDNVRQSNPLMESCKAVESQMRTVIENSVKDWDASQTTRELSDCFADKAILLVFGKVNAGKSSLCNYVASLFHSSDVQFFYLEGGQVEKSDEPFQEGVTETTARIQG